MTSQEIAAARPPVNVTCTGCGRDFTSRAARHVIVRCPGCGHAVRVKRPRPPGWKRRLPARRSPESVCEEKPAAYVTPVPASVLPSPLPPPSGDEDQDDDGYAYMRGPDGARVLADLTPDGQLVAVILIDQRFRSIAPGYCSVYGCTGPARHLARGWPVCPGCRRELAS